MRVDAAQNKFYELGKNFMNHQIALTTRVNLLNSLVRGRLTYASQTWSVTKKQTDHINAIYMSMLRKMVKGGYRRKEGTYKYELRNSDILRRCKTEDINQFIARLQRNFTAHLIRKEDDKLTKQLLFNDNTRRKPGRSTNLYTSVCKNEKCTGDEFNIKSMLRKF